LPKNHDNQEAGDWLVRLIRTLAESAKMATSIAVLGGFLLALLTKTGMDWFYAKFDLTPGEVGLDQASILFQTAATAIVVVAGSALVGLGVSGALTRVARRGNHTAAVKPPFRSLISEPSVVKRAVLVTLVLLLGYYVWGVETAEQSIARIRSGNSTSLQIFAHGQIVAWCVEAWWNDPRLDALFGGLPGRQLIFFGQASGIAAFYDAKTQHTIRIPISDIVTRSC
jgi:hypothetical protein